MEPFRKMMPGSELAAVGLPTVMANGASHATVASHGVDYAADRGNFLGPHDLVGTTFYIACNMMLAFTVFFLMQVPQVAKQWKTSVTTASIVTGVAFYNYCYMKETWVHEQNSPTNYRYTDWLITVPLQILEFYLILKASDKGVNASLGVRMFVASVAMVGFGWLAEIDVMSKVGGFILGCLCWLYIVFETFNGEAAACAAGLKSESSKLAFNYLRLIVSVGWIIYPAGFAVAYIIPGNTIRPDGEGPPFCPLNIIYNLADLVNKGAFGLAVYTAAAQDSEQMSSQLDLLRDQMS